MAETVGITAKGTRGLGGILVAGQHRVNRAQNTLGQQGLTLRQHYLAGGSATLQEDFNHFFGLDLQLRHGFSQRGSHLMQRQNRLFTGQNGVGVIQQLLPVALHRLHFLVHGRGRRGQAGSRVAFFQVTPALAEIITCIAEQPERSGFTGSGFSGVFGDTLRKHPQLARMADVLLVVVGLGIEVSKVGEQQHDEHDQGDKKHDDLRTTARPFHWFRGIGYGHRSGPGSRVRAEGTTWRRLIPPPPKTAGPGPEQRG